MIYSRSCWKFTEKTPSGLLQLRSGIFDISVGELSNHSAILERALSVEDNCKSRAGGAWEFSYDKHLDSELTPRIKDNRENRTFDYDTTVFLEKLQTLKNRGMDLDLNEVVSYMESIKNHQIAKGDIFPLAYNGQFKDGCWCRGTNFSTYGKIRYGKMTERFRITREHWDGTETRKISN